MKLKSLLLVICACSLLMSCMSYDKTYCVNYQAIRQKYAQPTSESPIPDEAEIAVAYTISHDSKLTAIVFNRTSEIMTIDQTQSFFVDTDGKSTSYYDPTVRTTSTTDLSSTSKGASINLGSIAGAFGIGGFVGQLANGINIGGSGTSGQSITNTTYISDLPQVALAPNSNGAMSKTFKISNLHAFRTEEKILPLISQTDSPHHFSVCISYSFDSGKTFKKIVTEFYIETFINVHLKKEGKISDALRIIEKNKPDMYNTPLWSLCFINSKKYIIDKYVSGIIYDYK